MKWGVALFAICAVLAAPASASAPTLGGLQRQVQQLRLQVAVLSGTVANLQQTVQKNQDYEICDHAQTLDLSNAIWHVLNVDLAYQGFAAQPDLPRYDDGGACQRIGQTRIR